MAPKGAIFVASETSLVKALVKFESTVAPHCAHKRHVRPEAFPAHFLYVYAAVYAAEAVATDAGRLLLWWV